MPDDALDPDGCEARWVCYAWPERFDFSGRRTFVVDHTGAIFATEDERYSGTSGPAPGAVYATGGIRVIGDAPSANGQDGNVWLQVN